MAENKGEGMNDIEHVCYPHEPGTLHDCLGCETECFCYELNHDKLGHPRWLNRVSCLYCIQGFLSKTG